MSEASGVQKPAETEPVPQWEDRPLTPVERRRIEGFQASQRWFLGHEADLRASHAGQFVAVQDGVFIASAPNLDGLLAGLPLDCDRDHLFLRRVPASGDPDEILWS